MGVGDGVSKSIDWYVTTISRAPKLRGANEVEGLATLGNFGFQIVGISVGVGGGVASDSMVTVELKDR